MRSSLGAPNGPVTCFHGPDNGLPLIFTGCWLATAVVRSARSRDARRREVGAGVKWCESSRIGWKLGAHVM